MRLKSRLVSVACPETREALVILITLLSGQIEHRQKSMLFHLLRGSMCLAI